MNKYLILTLSILFMQNSAYAEVLDKFGGCAYPPIWIHILLLIPIFIVAIVWIKRSRLFVLALSATYILYWVATFISFRFFKGANWLVDNARHDYFLEINSCAQYSTLSYWGQIAVGCAMLGAALIFSLLFAHSRNENEEA